MCKPLHWRLITPSDSRIFVQDESMSDANNSTDIDDIPDQFPMLYIGAS